MEIVWINDGSDELHTKLLKKMLEIFIKNTRFTSLVYCENEKNIGVSASLNKGVLLCNNTIIMRMDSDDIMFHDRIYKQYQFMNNNPNIHICGAQILMFRDNINNILSESNHKSLSFEDYKKTKSHWIMNHPTLCYRKEKIIEIGNYNKDLKLVEDLELELRMLKRFNYIYNFNEPLLYYRVHENQVTQIGKKNPEYWENFRNKIIESLIN
jgi:cellulose synthase/poly-beta-1,6-N-acetylglucosamine synthase-like glycosyltransferase